MAETENSRLCTVDVLEKLYHADDSQWVAPSFFAPAELHQCWKTNRLRVTGSIRE